jgi:hypothetical protein
VSRRVAKRSSQGKGRLPKLADIEKDQIDGDRGRRSSYFRQFVNDVDCVTATA